MTHLDCGPDDRCPDCSASAVHAPCREVIRCLVVERDEARAQRDEARAYRW